MTLSAVLFYLDRATSLRRFLAVQHEKRIAPRSTCPLDLYQQLFLALDQNGHVWKDIVYQQLIAHLQLKGVTVSELLHDYISEFAKTSVLFPETCHMLKQLRASYRLGLITNGRSDLQRAVIVHHQLQTFFDPIMISEEVGLSKPNPELFLRPLINWGLAPENVLFIGDHPLHDIKGAEAVGMTVILKTDHSVAASPSSYTVNDWSELEPILIQLHSERRSRS
ncbi:HAD family hydrolase [Exiguobacterium antarcticum]|uniref:HAD family hydrolase n=1 Tax=Exiguobacterium antarcticum TaxID=132920 RepID=UPI00068FBC8F|nr:HAD-IA family hydrolase [Exiguobacterium antarcticum]